MEAIQNVINHMMPSASSDNSVTSRSTTSESMEEKTHNCNDPTCMKEEIREITKIVDNPIVDSVLTPFQKKLLIGFLVLIVSLISFTATVLNFIKGTQAAVATIYPSTTSYTTTSHP